MDERSLRDIIREELKKLSTMTWGERIGYIWDYYKPLLAAIAGIVVLISVVTTVYHNLQINHLLNVYFINCNAMDVDADEIEEDFVSYIGGIDKNDEILVDTSLSVDDQDTSQYGVANQMKLTAVSAAGDMDIVLFDQKQYERYRDADGLKDLSTILSKEQMEEWSDALEHSKSAEAGGEIVCALDVTDAPLIRKYNAYAGDPVYAVVLATSSHDELLGAFFSFLMEES